MKDKKPNIESAAVTARVISRLLRKNGFQMCNMKGEYWTEGFYVESRFGGWVAITWHDNTVNYNVHDIETPTPAMLRLNEKKNKIRQLLSERGYVFDIDLSATSSNPPLRIKCKLR